MSKHEPTDNSAPEHDPRFQRRDEHGRPILPFVEQEGNTTRLFVDPLSASPEENQRAFEQSMELFFAQLEREWNNLPRYYASDIHCPVPTEGLSDAFQAVFPPDMVFKTARDPRTLANLHVPDGYAIEILDDSALDAAGERVYTFHMVKQESGDA